MRAAASPTGSHSHAVIPSARWGTGSPVRLRMRKKVQNLWMVSPSCSKVQSTVSIFGPTASGRMPVSSSTSRAAVSRRLSPPSM